MKRSRVLIVLTTLAYAGVMSYIAVPPAGAWVARYNVAGASTDIPNAIVADSVGHCYVTGRSVLDGQRGYATVAYDPSGTLLWEAFFATEPVQSEYATVPFLALDASENLIVAGTIMGQDYYSRDYLTIKYDAEGNPLWVAQLDGTGGTDSAVAMVTDASDNVYVTGTTSHDPVTKFDYLTVKYDPQGNELWAVRYSGPLDSYDEAKALAVDQEGNVYVTGESESDPPGGGEDYLTVKYDSEGNERWTARYNGPDDREDTPVAIRADSFGRVFVTGTAWTAFVGGSCPSCPVGDYVNMATVAYDSSGNELWADLRGDSAAGMALDAAGNVYVIGNSLGEATGVCVPHFPPPGTCSIMAWNRFFLVLKYDPAGSLLWSRSYGAGEWENYAFARALAVDAAGNVFVTGSDDGDYITTRYDNDGNPLWAARYELVSGSSDQGAVGIAIDPSSNVFITGFDEPSSTDYDYVTVRYVDGDPPCVDDDGDGFGDPASPVCTSPEPDCDDGNPDIRPDMAEICDDAAEEDEDCDGLANAADPDCAPPPWGSASTLSAVGVDRPDDRPSTGINVLSMFALPLVVLALWWVRMKATRRDGPPLPLP